MTTIATRRTGLLLLPAERALGAILLAIGLADVSLIALKGVEVDATGYAGTLAVAGGLFLGGLFYRHVRRVDAIGDGLVAAAMLIAFTNVMSLMNYLFLPLARPRIDATLAGWDAALGFSWSEAVVLAADWPRLAALGGAVYDSSLPQFIIVTVALAFCRHRLHLMRFLAATVATGTAAVLFWIVWPSFGPTVEIGFPAAAAGLATAVDADYAGKLLALAGDGPTSVSPSDVRGLIAFPSYHTVMAGLATLAAWPIRWLRWPILALNVVMLPTIVVHGGHFLVDLLAGAALTAAVWLALMRVPARRLVGDA